MNAARVTKNKQPIYNYISVGCKHIGLFIHRQTTVYIEDACFFRSHDVKNTKYRNSKQRKNISVFLSTFLNMEEANNARSNCAINRQINFKSLRTLITIKYKVVQI